MSEVKYNGDTINSTVQEIDLVGNLWGIELMKRIQKAEWLNTALNFKNCRVFIKDCLSQ